MKKKLMSFRYKMLFVSMTFSMVSFSAIGITAAQSRFGMSDMYDYGSMDGMGDMMGVQTPSPLDQQINYLKKARTDEQKEIVKKRIRNELGQQYDAYLSASSDELKKLETRLVRLRETLQARKKTKDKLIDLELQRIINEAEGLVWPKKMNQRDQGGSMETGGGMGGMRGMGSESSFAPNTPAPMQARQEALLVQATAPKSVHKFTISKNEAENQRTALRQIGLACLNYESANMHFPVNIVDEIGEPLLSWRVAILPFIEEMELYEKFHLNEPWDSPHNKKLIAEMPSIYLGEDPNGKTNRLGISDKGGVFEAGRKINFGHISDGSSNTILCVAANGEEHSRFWTKPADLTIDQFIEMASDSSEVGVVICDGSTPVLSGGIARSELRNLATRDDGNRVTALLGKK